MKTLLCTVILAAISVAAARADDITITLDDPTQIGSPGETLEFFGTITNTSAATLYLNSDSITLDGLSLGLIDQFFNNVPIFLGAGDSSGDVELFDVTVSNPLVDPSGTYDGSYELIGGLDGEAQDDVGSTNFSVTTVPEPSTIYLLLVVASVSLVLISRKARA
jgi:hypothetical protein